MHPLNTLRIQRRLAKDPSQVVEGLLRRLKVQIEFADALARQLKNQEFETLAIQAEHRVAHFEGDVDALSALVTEIEALLAPIGAKAKKFTVHCVGHGHIDMNWMWSWPETVAATHDTFASVLNLMREYPQLTYSQSQASVYELIERYHPAMFAEIQERVKEGRWEITAVHWVEGDKNLAHGESLARHLLYTRQYIGEKFGLSPEDVPLDWEPDTFGHANTVPSILAQGGVKFYYSCRTGGGHHHPRVGDERPPLFWWEAPNGARVLVNRETTWYNSYVNIGENIALPLLTFHGQTGLSHWLNIYGVGNHGGGPTHREIQWLTELQSYPIYPSVAFSTAKAFYESALVEIEDRGLDIPVIAHELNFEFTGCYTSQSTIKRANRFGEQFCLEAETLAALSGIPAQKQLRDAWIPVLFNQFHDILPGSGVTATREHASGIFQETGAITGAIKREALKSLVAKIDTLSLLPDNPEGKAERERVSAGGVNFPFEAGVGQGAGHSGFSIASGGGRRFFPVTIYNPCAWERSEIVEVNLWDIEVEASLLVARDEDGCQYPTQVLSQSPDIWRDWGHVKTTLVFPAMNIPALGYKTFLFCEGVPTAEVPQVFVDGLQRFRAGALTLHFDRDESGVEAVDDARMEGGESWGPQLRWAMTRERARGMTSWVVGGETGDADRPVPLPSKHYWVSGAARNQGTDQLSGSNFAYFIRQELSVPGTESKVTVHGTVHALSPRVDFSAEIDWREIGTWDHGIPGLEIQAFTPDWEERRFETPFGSVERNDCLGSVVPTLRYVHVADEVGAITYLQDWAYGWKDDPMDPAIKVVRSSFDPDHAPEVGKSTLRYSVVFHTERQKPSDLTRLGAAHQHSLIVTGALLQSGELPASASYASVETPNVLLTSLKPSEAGEGIVVRLVEYDGEDTMAVVRLHPSLSGGTAEVVDLLERPIDKPVSLSGGDLRVPIEANSVVSVRIRRGS